nr:hypothetical protein [Tanacetum cinerariifolium]
MSTQQDIYAAGSESRPPMLNKENYVSWSSRLLRYAKSRPNGKLIHNSILNGPYVRRMIPEPGDANREVTVTETFHVQIDDELSEKELKQIEADDQAIQTILLGLSEDIYAAEKKAKLFNEWERFTSNERESIESYYHRFLKLMNDLKRNKHFPKKISSNLKFLNNLQPKWSRQVIIFHQTKDLHTADYTQLYDFLKYNQKENYLQQPMPNPKDITDPTTAMNISLALMAKAFKLNYSTPTNNNQRISSNLRNRQIAQPGMNMGQERQIHMVGGNGNQNQTGNGNLVAARTKGNAAGQNGNQIRCYNCRGVEYDLMAAAADLDEIEEVNTNCILMANLQQASTSATQTNSALVYDSDGSAEVHENCDDNEIFNKLTQEEQYTKLLEPIPESHQVPQNDNDVISEDTSVDQGGEIVEQHRVNFEETHALYDSLYQNLAIKVEKVNSVNRKLKETNADLTTKLARFKNQIRDFKSLANEANASLARQKALELEIERLLKVVVSQDIMNIVQKESVVNTSDLQTELEHTRNPLSQKLDNENVELEFQVLNYARENAHLKATYKNMFHSISVSRTQTKTIIASLQNELQSTIYTNAKLRTKLFKKVSNQKDNTHDTSKNTKFAKQSILGKPPMLDEIQALSKPVTSNSVSTPQESKGVNNDKVIAPGMFRINPDKTSRGKKNVYNTVRASIRTKPITISQTPVFTKKDVNSNSNGLSSIGVDNTAKTKRTKPKSSLKKNKVPYVVKRVDNTAKTKRTKPKSSSKKNKVPYVVKSSYKKNKEADVEENHRNLLSSSNKKHVSSKCNNVKLATQNVYSKVVCAMCKQCLFSVNHDVCLRNYVNGINSHEKKQNANVSNVANQKKHKAQLWKPKNVGSKERLASPKPSSPRSCLRWSPTRRFFDLKGKIITSSESESQSDCSRGDNVCFSNPLEPISKRFPNSTFSMT